MSNRGVFPYDSVDKTTNSKSDSDGIFFGTVPSNKSYPCLKKVVIGSPTYPLLNKPLLITRKYLLSLTEIFCPFIYW